MTATENAFLLGKYTEAVVSEIVEKYNFTAEDALRKFLFSETYKMLCDPKCAMFSFAPSVIFELWECEQVTGNPRNSVYIRGEA